MKELRNQEYKDKDDIAKLKAQIRECAENIDYLQTRILKEKDLLVWLNVVLHIKEMEVKRDEKV